MSVERTRSILDRFDPAPSSPARIHASVTRIYDEGIHSSALPPANREPSEGRFRVINLLALTPLGRNRHKSRLWIEAHRLDALGVPPDTPFTVETRSEGLILRPAVLAENHVSSRRTANGLRPIIDVANQTYLGPLGEFPELNITGWHERLSITTTRRAAAILRSRHLTPPFRVLEVFAGGGTLTAAVAGNDAYTVWLRYTANGLLRRYEPNTTSPDLPQGRPARESSSSRPDGATHP